MGIFVWNQVFRRFAKWNLTTLNFTLFLNKQCYIQIYDDLEESEFDEIDEEWEEEEEEKETTLERTSLNQFLIQGQRWKVLSPLIPETKIVGKWYACIFKTKKKTDLYIGRATRRFLNDEGGLSGTGNRLFGAKIRCSDNILKQGQQDMEFLL